MKKHLTMTQMMTTTVPNRPTAEPEMIIPNLMKQEVDHKMKGPVGKSSDQKQKNRQSQQKSHEKIGKRKHSSKSRSKNKLSDDTHAEMKKSSDDSIFAHDYGTADVLSTSFGNLRTHSTSCSLTEKNGFYFKEIGSHAFCEGKVLCCHFSSDGKLLASAGDGKKVFLWDMTSYDWVASAGGPSDVITDVRFKPNSQVFGTSSIDGTVQIWDSNKPSKPIFTLLGHYGQVTSIDFHPNKGDILCSCASNDEIKMWTIDQLACTSTFKGASRQVRFQPQSGTLLAAASGNRISLFDVKTNQLEYCLEGHVKEVKSICWDASGKYLASVSEESVRLWSIVSSGKCVHKLQSNGTKFESCTFHPGYSNVLIIGSNQSLELWNSIENDRTLTVSAHTGIVAALSDCTKTGMMSSGGHDSCIKVWK